MDFTFTLLQDEKGRVIALGFATADKREVKSFLSMLYDTGPFDLVVDGMNVYYHVLGHSSKYRNEQSGALVGLLSLPRSCLISTNLHSAVYGKICNTRKCRGVRHALCWHP